MILAVDATEGNENQGKVHPIEEYHIQGNSTCENYWDYSYYVIKNEETVLLLEEEIYTRSTLESSIYDTFSIFQMY